MPRGANSLLYPNWGSGSRLGLDNIRRSSLGKTVSLSDGSLEIDEPIRMGYWFQQLSPFRHAF